jgi:hypothetical protein
VPLNARSAYNPQRRPHQTEHMPKQKKPYKLFEVTGIELEYMVVDRDT